MAAKKVDQVDQGMRQLEAYVLEHHKGEDELAALVAALGIKIRDLKAENKVIRMQLSGKAGVEITPALVKSGLLARELLFYLISDPHKCIACGSDHEKDPKHSKSPEKVCPGKLWDEAEDKVLD